jgi:hypothetical protein
MDRGFVSLEVDSKTEDENDEDGAAEPNVGHPVVYFIALRRRNLFMLVEWIGQGIIAIPRADVLSLSGCAFFDSAPGFPSLTPTPIYTLP